MRFSSRRKAELSFNLIVLFLLALIIMGILIYVFYDKSAKFGDALTSCTANGGICMKDVTSCNNIKTSSGELVPGVPIFKTDCARINSDKPTCCKPVG